MYSLLLCGCKYTIVKEALSSLLVFIFTNPIPERDADYLTLLIKLFLRLQSQFLLSLPKNQDKI
jgi:hypothetical protein